jgi:hypothetical protein
MVLAVACTGGSEPASSSSDPPLVHLIPATDQRPYSIMLPVGWNVENTVHSDGASFILPPADERGQTTMSGRLQGVVDPGGRLIPPAQPVGQARIHAIEEQYPGSKVTVRRITVDGHPAWEALVAGGTALSENTMLVSVDLGKGAGISLSFFWSLTPERSVEFFRRIVQSVHFDEEKLSQALATASPA